MKRSLFIIIGIVFILLLIAVWVYVLFSGSPQNLQETFSDFGFGDTTDTTSIPTSPVTPVEPEPVVDIASKEKLRQLTTKPVVGFTEVQTTPSSTPEIYYIESGTGHIYSINLVSGAETRVSATTIPGSNAGSITPNGNFAMMQSGTGGAQEFTVATINPTGQNLSTITLTEPITSFSATINNTFLYAVTDSNSLTVKQYFPISNVVENLFTVPFREATVAWGSSATSTHYVYPKTASKLEGYVYAANGSSLRRTPVDGFGLSASGNDQYLLFGKQTSDLYQSFFYSQTRDTTEPLPITLIPEKCGYSPTTVGNIICAQTFTKFDERTPDTWYTGEVTYADNLWRIDPFGASAELLVNTLSTSGRELDSINLQINPANTAVYFQNKRDQTVWMYELST